MKNEIKEKKDINPKAASTNETIGAHARNCPNRLVKNIKSSCLKVILPKVMSP